MFNHPIDKITDMKWRKIPNALGFEAFFERDTQKYRAEITASVALSLSTVEDTLAACEKAILYAKPI